MTLSTHLISMASRSIGVRADEVHGYQQRQVHNGLARLEREGKLHKAKVEHRHVRFFAHATMRDTFMEQVKLAGFQAKHDSWGFGKGVREGVAPWGADEPAITPDHVKVQICPAFRPRFEEHTFGFLHGVA